jgi:DNA repair protein RecO (recombination protein O)
MVVVRDRALLLRRHAYSESSLVVHVCTRDHGRVDLIAKGAYRPTSRYFAVLDYFDTLEIEWDYNPERELSNLRAGSILRRRRALSGNLPCFRAAFALIELVDVASRPAQPEPHLWDLLERALEELQAHGTESKSRPDVVRIVFELALLEHLGLGISLERCAACGGLAPPLGRAEPRAAFSASAGGRLCSACADAGRKNGRRVGTMPVRVLDDARRMLQAGAAACADHAAERIDRVRDLVERFLDHHLETRPRTQRAFLAQPNRNAPRSGVG